MPWRLKPRTHRNHRLRQPLYAPPSAAANNQSNFGLALGPRQGMPTECLQQCGPALYSDSAVPQTPHRRRPSNRCGGSPASCCAAWLPLDGCFLAAGNACLLSPSSALPAHYAVHEAGIQQVRGREGQDPRVPERPARSGAMLASWRSTWTTPRPHRPSPPPCRQLPKPAPTSSPIRRAYTAGRDAREWRWTTLGRGSRARSGDGRRGSSSRRVEPRAVTSPLSERLAPHARRESRCAYSSRPSSTPA